ncbi:MAG TPA: AMP-binding protein [Polyangiaceae bacterium]|nr:AMP-binding protein [Polyangiaceae bacterium]
MFDPALPHYPSIVHALWAAVRDNHEGLALACGERRVSFGELGFQVRRLRQQLLELGAQRERVAILLPSSIEAVIALLATMAAGAQAAPINPFFKVPELRVVLKEAEPKLLLVGPEARDKVAGLLGELGVAHTFEIGTPAGFDSRAHWSDRTPSADPNLAALDAASDPAPDDAALLIFTGGTTGEPKAVVHSHRALSVSLLQHVSAWPVVPRGERFLSAAPIFHIWGLAYATFIPIYCQSAHVIISKYDPELVLLALEAETITVFSGGPAPVYMLLTQHARFKTTNFSSLKYCLTGGAPCPEDLHQLWEQQTGCALLEGWGMSEAAPLCLSRPGARKLLSVGRPVVGTQVEVVDLETGSRVLGAGEAGEVRIRGPQLMLGYRAKPEATREVLRDGWLYTGDIGYLDAEGDLFLVDRKKDMIIVGGFNVYPRQVDEVLFKHPKIAEVASVGIPDAMLGEVLVAFVVRTPGATLSEDEFFDYCRANLVKYRRPVAVTFLDSLPRTNARKLDKKALRALARQPSA